MRIALLLFCFLLVPSLRADEKYRCLQVDPKAEREYCISIYRLLVSPNEFDGKLVSVEGYAHFEFEGSGIYPHKSDYEESLFTNGIWVDLDSARADKNNDKYVTIVGRFRAGRGGHRGLWSGELYEVQRIY